ncbi:hypothetical protein ISCGN_016848 [Ixodes scapularis]
MLKALKGLKVLSILEHIRESEYCYGDTTDAVSQVLVSREILRKKDIKFHSFTSSRYTSVREDEESRNRRQAAAYHDYRAPNKLAPPAPGAAILPLTSRLL